MPPIVHATNVPTYHVVLLCFGIVDANHHASTAAIPAYVLMTHFSAKPDHPVPSPCNKYWTTTATSAENMIVSAIADRRAIFQEE
jgi:hypothetical protein